MISSLCGMFEGVLLLLAETGSEPTPSNFWMPEGASKQAAFVDLSFYIINWINYFFFGLVTIVLVWFAIKYRQRSKHVEFSEGLSTTRPSKSPGRSFPP